MPSNPMRMTRSPEACPQAFCKGEAMRNVSDATCGHALVKCLGDERSQAWRIVHGRPFWFHSKRTPAALQIVARQVARLRFAPGLHRMGTAHPTENLKTDS